MLEKNLAQYVVTLEDAAATSKKTADMPLYQKYRAHAGLLLALAVLDEDRQPGPEFRVHVHLCDSDGGFGQTQKVE